MDKKNTGGPAFPVPGDQHDESFNGATLRDYFAAKALSALIGGRSWMEKDGELIEAWAKASYAIADAMLLERAK